MTLKERIAAIRKRFRGRIRRRTKRLEKKRDARIEEVRAKADATRVSDKGLEFIARWEGWRAQPYNDVAGHCTIGYGHLIHQGNCTAADRQKWGTISKARGLELLRDDAATAEKAVRDRVKVKLKQHQFDALVSFTYNVGTGAFGGSTLLRKLNEGNYASVPPELMRWVNAGGVPVQGLVNRRREEGAMWSQGKYG